MALEVESEQAIFENAGQAVHVAFLIMAQEATQDAPLRKALIRVMESIRLTSNQRNWLDELRGTPSGSVNFGGLDGNEIRAQCAMVTLAVRTILPKPEMWVLQAKFGQTDFEDVVSDSPGDKMAAALAKAKDYAAAARRRLAQAQVELDGVMGAHARMTGRPQDNAAAMRAIHVSYDRYRKQLLAAQREVVEAEGKERAVQVAIDQVGACRLLDNGKAHCDGLVPRRRFVFSAERIAAISGLSDWFRPMFPSLPAMAIDCLLGRIFANNKKLDISVRDLAKSFGGSHMTYQRASKKMLAHVRVLEKIALGRLEETFMAQGLVSDFSESD